MRFLSRIRFWRHLIAWLVIMATLEAMEAKGAFIGIIEIGVTLALIWNMLETHVRRSGGIHALLSRLQKEPSAAITPKDVANAAMGQAGYRANANALQLLDIGVLTYDGGKQPRVSRVETIPAYVTRLRPFASIQYPHARAITLTVRFELINEMGQVRFMADERYQFKRGKNFITPPSWLPMGDNDSGGDWTLLISIIDQPFARHYFRLAPDMSTNFRTYLRPDGEIDEWLARSAEQALSDDMSLDELLGDQVTHSTTQH
jgi:hypothetical protein